jgi:hypothetical protein
VHPAGAADWSDLFKPTPQWSAVASNIQVFVISAGYVIQTPGPQVKAALADLTSRHIKIALGVQSIDLQPTDQCGHEEGYQNSEYSEKAAIKLHSLGIKLSILALDEPVWFGHYEPSDQGCRFGMKELVQRVAMNVRAYVRLFPHVDIGDVEPIPVLTEHSDWKSIFDTFSEELRASVGHPLVFLHTDVSWRNPSYPQALREVAQFTASRKLQLGIIYKGDDADKNAAEWVAEAIRRFNMVEDELQIQPVQASFATWEPYPQYVLPEDSDFTLSHVIARYVLPRTRISAEFREEKLIGSLRSLLGAPIANAKIALLVSRPENASAPATQTLSGTVPKNARFAIIGLRVNAECLCSGYNDFVIGDPRYEESGIGHTAYKYALVSRFASRSEGSFGGGHVNKVTEQGRTYLRITIDKNDRLGINSEPFRVTGGANYQLQIPVQSMTKVGIFGEVTLIWLNQERQGFHRANLFVGPYESLIGITLTKKDGTFEFAQNFDRTATEPLKLEFEGNDKYRAAALNLR